VVDVAPDDSRIIVGDNEGALIQWDLRSHKAAVFSDGGLPIGAMDYSPDGQVVYLIRQGLPSQVSSIETWDAATARRLSEMQLPHHILNDVVALDHDNAIITGNGSSDGVTDPDFLVRWQWTDNTVHPLPNASPTGQVVPVVAGLLMERHVTNRPRELLVVDPRSNAPLSEPIELGDDYLVDLDSTPDRRFAVALAGQAILLIDGSSGRLVERRSVAMNPVGARFVGNSRLAVMIASGLGVPRTGEGIHSFEVPSLTESPFVIALNTLSRDMSALHDSPVVLNSRIGGGVALWNFRAGAEFPGSFSRALTPHAEVPDSVSFAPDGATVFIASGSSVSAVAWDDATNRWPTKELGSPFRIHASSVRPDGRVLAVGGENQHNSGLVILVNSETSQVIKKFDVGPTAVQRMAFSPNGRYLFIATGAILGIGHGNVLALDTTNGRTREFGGPQPPVDLTVVGDRVVWLAQDGRIGSCPVNFAPDCSPTELDLGLERYVGDVWVGLSNKIAPTGRGQEIALLEGHRVGLVDLAANKPSVHWLGSHLAAVNGLTADPRSATLASTDFNGELILWDLDSDQPLISPTDLEGISRRLWSTYSPSGSELLLVNEAGLRSIKGNPRSWPDLACGIAGRNLTADEWNTYVGTGREREQPCPTP
jgi:WD40 repeat protein